MSGITVKAKGLDVLLKNIDKLGVKATNDVQGEIDTFLFKVKQDAQQTVQSNSSDEGYLANHIQIKNGNLSGSVVVAADYAAFVEFGTRKFAKQYVATLPQDWQAYAAKFKGKGGGGDMYDFLLAILKWIQRKGIRAGVYNVATKRRLGNKATKEKEDLQMANAIAYKILREGSQPHPFLYPAYRDNIATFRKRIKELFK